MARPTFLAWYNLIHDRPRTAVALSGVSFSLLVIFLQLGFRRAVEQTATIVLDRLDYDIMIVSRHYRYLADARSFPRVRLEQARSVGPVSDVVPLYVRPGSWRSLAPVHAAGDPGFGRLGRLVAGIFGEAGPDDTTWRRRSILVFGVDLNDRPFHRDGPSAMRNYEVVHRRLARPGTLLIDERSRKEFGPQEDRTRVELNRERFEIVGRIRMGTGFAADGATIMSDRNFARAYGPDSLENVTLGLVRLNLGRSSRPSGLAKFLKDLTIALRLRPDSERAGVERVAHRLRSRLPSDDVRVLTRAEIEAQEQNYWINEKAIGILFTMGVYVSFLVGMVLAYQVLSSDIADRRGEYATLKAMGHTPGRLSSVVIQQGLLLGLIGYVAALAVAIVLYRLVEYSAQIPMELTVETLRDVLASACLMTGASALLSIRKINAADPADLFR